MFWFILFLSQFARNTNNQTPSEEVIQMRLLFLFSMGIVALFVLVLTLYTHFFTNSHIYPFI